MTSSSLSCPPVRDNLISTLNQDFINFAISCSNPVPEAGCAYDVATLPALARDATVIANDLDPRHLEILKAGALPRDRHRLHLRPGPLEDLTFKADSLGAVLNFLSPAEIVDVLHRLYQWLEKDGKVFLLQVYGFFFRC